MWHPLRERTNVSGAQSRPTRRNGPRKTYRVVPASSSAGGTCAIAAAEGRRPAAADNNDDDALQTTEGRREAGIVST